MKTHDPSVASDLLRLVLEAVDANGGWLGFDAYMQLALYAPSLGYYSRGDAQIGLMPTRAAHAAAPVGAGASGSDFATAPEMSPLFGRALAAQVAQALAATGTDEVWEFGAGTGALALSLLDALDAMGTPVRRYTIVDVSASLRARQQAALAHRGAQVSWASALPETMTGVLLGNEVLDAMPVKLLARLQGVWYERGVVRGDAPGTADGPRQDALLQFADRPTTLRPPVEIAGPHDYITETHAQGEGFIRTLASRLRRGAAFFIDYGFPESEYYHPQRHMGTLMAHHQHRSDMDLLSQPGERDLTAHVNFTGIALAAQEAGWDCLGYTSQARFLINCGLPELMQHAPLAGRNMALRLIHEHEMGELFKVIGFAPQPRSELDAPANMPLPWRAIGFASGDRTHTL